MKLEDIGFYTLEDFRAANTTSKSPLWRCELILTDTCNFKCPYCRGIEEEHKGNISWEEATAVIDAWSYDFLRNIRFSGGEPTLWKGYETVDGVRERRSLIDLVAYACSRGGVNRVAVSTNGSVDTDFYYQLIHAGVTDFSISLDACCAETGDHMAGDKKGAWAKVVDNIRKIAPLVYTTVGVVFNEDNVHEFNKVIEFASNLGVADIRVLTSAQWDEGFRDVKVDRAYLDKHPILKYRMNNFMNGRHVRGLTDTDNTRCPLALDDMAVLDGFHYPCIIYMREQGKPIGRMISNVGKIYAGDEIHRVRKEREEWVDRTNTHKDPICKKNCLDVCVDYNNRVAELNPNIRENKFFGPLFIPIYEKNS